MGAKTHSMHMKKGKDIQNISNLKKKLKLIFTEMQWKPLVLKPVFLHMVRNIRMSNNVVKLIT